MKDEKPIAHPLTSTAVIMIKRQNAKQGCKVTISGVCQPILFSGQYKDFSSPPRNAASWSDSIKPKIKLSKMLDDSILILKNTTI